MIWKRASQALAAFNIAYGSGQKGRVAKALRSSLLKAATIHDLPVETQEYARKLIQKIRDIFPPEEKEAAVPATGKVAPKRAKKTAK